MSAQTELPVFEGTQVPVNELHSYMLEDWNLYGFLHRFPSVAMEQALAEMEQHARKTVLQRSSASMQQVAKWRVLWCSKGRTCQ